MTTFKAEVSWKKKQASGWGAWLHNQGKDGGSAFVKLHNVLSTEVNLVCFLVRLEDQKWFCLHAEAPWFSEAVVQQIILSNPLASVTGKVIVSHCGYFFQGVVWPGTTFCGNSSLTYSFHGHFVNKSKRNERRILSFSHLTLDCFLRTSEVCSRLRETVHSSAYGSAMPGLLLCWQESMPTVPPHRFSTVILENPLPIALGHQ